MSSEVSAGAEDQDSIDLVHGRVEQVVRWRICQHLQSVEGPEIQVWGGPKVEAVMPVVEVTVRG